MLWNLALFYKKGKRKRKRERMIRVNLTTVYLDCRIIRWHNFHSFGDQVVFWFSFFSLFLPLFLLFLSSFNQTKQNKTERRKKTKVCRGDIGAPTTIKEGGGGVHSLCYSFNSRSANDWKFILYSLKLFVLSNHFDSCPCYLSLILSPLCSLPFCRYSSGSDCSDGG